MALMVFIAQVNLLEQIEDNYTTCTPVQSELKCVSELIIYVYLVCCNLCNFDQGFQHF